MNNVNTVHNTNPGLKKRELVLGAGVGAALMATAVLMAINNERANEEHLPVAPKKEAGHTAVRAQLSPVLYAKAEVLNDSPITRAVSKTILANESLPTFYGKLNIGSGHEVPQGENLSDIEGIRNPVVVDLKPLEGKPDYNDLDSGRFGFVAVRHEQGVPVATLVPFDSEYMSLEVSPALQPGESQVRDVRIENAPTNYGQYPTGDNIIDANRTPVSFAVAETR